VTTPDDSSAPDPDPDLGHPGPDPDPDAADPADPAALADLVALGALATFHGVATDYVGPNAQRVVVPADTVRTVLGLLGIDSSDPVAALARSEDAPWRQVVPPASVRRRSAPEPVLLRIRPRTRPTVQLDLELGGTVDLVDVGEPVRRRTVDGEPRVALPVRLPSDLPLGDHTVRVRAGADTGQGTVVIVPDRVPTIPPPPAAGGPPPRAWGWMVQLYALTSARSWGIGDFADLADLAAWSGSEAGSGADVLLVNPVHASAPLLPVQPSPYYPSSRRFVSPLYLRPELTPEYRAAPAGVRARVDALAQQARRAGLAGDLLDRDAVWAAKHAALRILFEQAERTHAVPAVVAGNEATAADRALWDFATWNALAEHHGADWRTWPAPLRDPTSTAVAQARMDYADRVAFHVWMQRRCSDQLARAQAAAREASMTVGVVHDLAVGVDPGGADAWAMSEVFAEGANMGAPPDAFTQLGQNWGLPPWRPDRLAESGYAPFREMVAAVLRRGGGLRIDHVLGLFRLWWIPAGRGASDGTYVRYDAEAMLGVLALEATKAGALVVGEDLGTVEEAVAGTLADVGVLGSSVLWFERGTDGRPRPPAAWRESAVATVTTHDLPTAAGYLNGEHIDVRAKLGVLARPEAAERASWRAERAALLQLLSDEGLVEPAVLPAALAGQTDKAVSEELVLALHRMLVATPARVVLAAIGDAFGDRRQPNLPGTIDRYPNWRLPVADADGSPVTLERLVVDPAARRLAQLMAGVRASSPRAQDQTGPWTADQ
jgi:4-alpha-glucanotransferase